MKTSDSGPSGAYYPVPSSYHRVGVTNVDKLAMDIYAANVANRPNEVHEEQAEAAIQKAYAFFKVKKNLNC